MHYRIDRLIIILVAVILGLTWPSVGVCAGLKLVLHSAKSSYLVDEPLLLSVAVRNDGDTAVEMPMLLDLNARYLRLCQVMQGQKPMYYDPGVFISMALPTSGIILGPGEEYSTRLWLAAYPIGGKSLLAAPGRYTLFVRYELPKEFPGGPIALRSSDAQINVMAPVGEEQVAHGLFTTDGKNKTPWAYPQTQTLMKARLQRYAALVSKYPSSAYAPYALSTYAADLYGMATLPESATTRKDQLEYLRQSMLQYRRFVEVTSQTPLEARALADYGRSLARLGDADSAAKAFESALICPTATTTERYEALSWTQLTESGVFREHLREADETYPLNAFTYRLFPCSRALGFTVEWDEKTQSATVTGQRVNATIQAGSQTIQVNGQHYPTPAAVISPAGDVCVPARTLGHLLVAHSGKPLLYLVRDVLP
jgi:hypothetical protein